MYVYVCLIALIILGSFILNKKSYVIFVSALLIICASLRHPSLGLGDVEKVYLPLFERSKELSLSEIFAEFSLSNGIGNLIIMKCFTLLHLPYQLFLAFNSAVFIIVAERLAYKYSKDLLLSQIILISSAYFFSFAVIRQYMALSFLLFAVPYLFNRKLLKFTITILIGALFHYTVLIALLLYPLTKFPRSDYLIIIIITAGLIFGLILQSLVISLVGIVYPQIYHYFSVGIYEAGSGLSYIWLLILLIPVILYFINFYNNSNKSLHLHKNEKCLYYDSTLVLSVGIMAYVLSAIVVEFYRFSQYFTIINIILLPNLINQVQNKSLKTVLRILAILLFLIYMMLSTLNNLNCLPYLFYWQ